MDNSRCEEIFISMSVGKNQIIFGGVYIPPASDVNVYLDHISSLDSDKLNGINAQIDPFIRHSARPRQTSHLELQSDRIQKAQDEDFKTSSSWSSSKPHQSPSAALRHFLGALKLGMYSGCLTQSI
ncbi:hypothetical protein Zmor_013900 [Zophobas morio]|uniref:Uncharacterized protein n=1 Tax=Zophobas morio TaxID=2755281 RepID=A0AA38MG03_9CUCU|nr:hypothetical protein Zmor_013900 [Zophobas morio]